MNDWLFRIRLQKFANRIQFCLNKLKLFVGWNIGEANHWIAEIQEEIKKMLKQ